jgi:hypothetical protein
MTAVQRSINFQYYLPSTATIGGTPMLQYAPELYMKYAIVSLFIALSGLALKLSAAVADTQPSTLAGQSFQIENLDQLLLLRPRDANSANGTPLVLYPHEAWKCMTWKLESSGDGYRLMNYFTHKTMQPDAAAVVEEPATKTDAPEQQWKFISLGNDLYRIENAKTGEALGASSDANITVGKWTDAPSQKWKLLPKPEKFTG